jgi:hypothetical protein
MALGLAEPARARSDRQIDVAFGDGANTRVHEGDSHLLAAELAQGVVDRFERALHVRFDHQLEVELAGLTKTRLQIFERDLGVRRQGATIPRLATGRDFLRLLQVLDAVHRIAGARHVVQADDLHGHTRARFIHLTATIVEHRADFAVRATG